MDTATNYEAIPRTPIEPISNTPEGTPSWHARIFARLPRRTSLKWLIPLSVAALVVLGVSFTQRSQEYFKPLTWTKFYARNVPRFGYNRFNVESYASPSSLDPFFVRGKFGGRCYRKCGQLPGPKVCCHIEGKYKKKRNTCACECQQGAVVGDCLCACKTDKSGMVCCSTPDGDLTTSSACACNCMEGAEVLSKGKCAALPPPPAPAPTETPPSPEPERPTACPKIFRPTCCLTKYGYETAPNKCECLKHGIEYKYEGQCSPTPLPSPSASPSPEPERPTACPKIFQPTCCLTKYGYETAPNKCECLKHGIEYKYEGQCSPTPLPSPSASPSLEPNPSTECPKIYQPACCLTKYGYETAPNKCECLKHGIEYQYEGRCSPSPVSKP